MEKGSVRIDMFLKRRRETVAKTVKVLNRTCTAQYLPHTDDGSGTKS